LAEKRLHDDAVLVIGLGRFGAAIADALDRLGHDVLAIDKNPDKVRDWSGRLTHVAEADGASLTALRQLGCQDVPIAVVGIGGSVEASVLATANLVDLGNKQVWAKALSSQHGRILERIGAHRVIYPERDAGEKVAHLVSGKMLDYIEFEDGFVMVSMRPPQETQGFTLRQSKIRNKYGVTVMGVKSPGEDFVYASPDTVITRHDTLIVSGNSQLIDRFAARP
jgi:trk system potassium uptake protein TrkA